MAPTETLSLSARLMLFGTPMLSLITLISPAGIT